MNRLSIQIDRHVIYAAHTLRDIKLTIEPGEIVCLLGQSGCGKSTTLRIVAGLQPPQYELIQIGERVLTGEGVFIPPEKRDIGVVFQHPALFPHMTVHKNVMFGLRGVPDAADVAQEWLEKVGLEDKLECYPHMLSGGQQQRVAIARAMAPEPRVMLLDEPFASLDHALRQQIRGDMIALLKESNKPTLLVSHDPDDALLTADRIAVMEHGKILQVGDAQALYGHPANSFIAGLFGELNQFPAKIQGGIVDTPLGSFPAPDMTSGTDCSFAVRPEHMALLPQDAGDEEDSVMMRVTAVRFTGRNTRITLHHAASDTEWVACEPADAAQGWNVGDEARVAPEGDKIMLFA